MAVQNSASGAIVVPRAVLQLLGAHTSPTPVRQRSRSAAARFPTRRCTPPRVAPERLGGRYESHPTPLVRLNKLGQIVQQAAATNRLLDRMGWPVHVGAVMGAPALHPFYGSARGGRGWSAGNSPARARPAFRTFAFSAWLVLPLSEEGR